MESKRRFVLFPIQYGDVRNIVYCIELLLIDKTDLAHVQESRGVVLDRRGNGPLERRTRLAKEAERQRAAFHLPRPCLFRRIRWHRQ